MVDTIVVWYLRFVYIARMEYLPMKMIQIPFKASEDEKESWSEKAKECGLSLSAWIRQRCNEDTTPREAEEAIEAREVASTEKKKAQTAKPAPKKDTGETDWTFNRCAAPERPKGDWSKCVHPTRVCSLTGIPSCGPCREANSGIGETES